eukprot:scaffold24245_cov39-Phaeocystis_antarctica.AAC.1
MDQQQSRKRALPPSCKTPFLCTAAGCLPRGVPDDVDDLLSAYLVSGVARTSLNLWLDPMPNPDPDPKPDPDPDPDPKPKPKPSPYPNPNQVSPAPAPTSTWRGGASSAHPTA